MGHTPLPSRPSTPSVVHPHARGAYQLKWRFWTPYNGSSPPTWGIRCSTAPTIDISRFIPTYVGHTPFANLILHVGAVHPHLRGAYAPGPSSYSFGSGSSPHTWGIPGRGKAHERVARFIPTYVGHTPSGSRPETTAAGSSPHTWGIHWITVRKMAGFSHFSYDFIRKSYFVQGLVFFGVIGAEAFPTHRRGRSQCLPGAHGGSVRNL